MRITNAPMPSYLMATARSFGNYDLAAALADLIDNCIKAKSTHIDISFTPSFGSRPDVVVRIRDNGVGMSKESLIAAMRPASANPQDERDEDDLGRFGWGLKSASLSQARVLKVVTWCANDVSAAIWDIDDIDDWSMDLLDKNDARKLLSVPVTTDSGTEVIWCNSDRLLDTSAGSSINDSLTAVIFSARQKLSLIFHRYLSGEIGKKLRILVNGLSLDAVDPFMTNNAATQTLKADTINMKNGANIYVQPYVLPHFSKMTVQEQERLGGPEGMVRNQGFYVYRNKRLIIYGTWFRIVPHGELSQLTRIKVDLPNTVDAEWRITLDKSDAQLPEFLRSRLKNIVKKFNKKSVAVHRNKGVSLEKPSCQSVWLRYVKNGQIKYVINRQHPMIESLLEQANENADAVIKLVESYFPADRFIHDNTDKTSILNQAITASDEFDEILHQCFINYHKKIDGVATVKGFLDFLSRIEPFASQWKYTESHVKTKIAEEWGIPDGL